MESCSTSGASHAVKQRIAARRAFRISRGTFCVRRKQWRFESRHHGAVIKPRSICGKFQKKLVSIQKEDSYNTRGQAQDDEHDD
ncbi:hypothetical protein KFE25_008160 [Diacronema lutheri]|uniref:Uncharacterized protein n=1 Tax=Diacronema lutheri TaxID=2081491 RepID=A0A8J5XDM8_DIALT|nr:hypothetical protein KFE25_008160 [Diacronema lutheri]